MSNINENDIAAVPILVGAFMFMKTELFLKADGFDERYFMYGEDIDLSYTVEKLGYNNYYYGKAKVIHYKGESTLRNKVYASRFYGAMYLFYKKHFRRNILLDGIIYVATKSIPLFLKHPVNKGKLLEVNNVVFVSNDEKKFEMMNKKYLVSIQKIQPNELQLKLAELSKTKVRTEVIFDNNCLSFKEIISIMDSFDNEFLSFKIWPKNMSYIIGSNSSEDRGEVKFFR